MATNSRVLPLIFITAFCIALIRNLVVPVGFVSDPHFRSTAVAPPIEEPKGSSLYGLLLPAAVLAVAPGLAEAASEREPSRFGVVFTFAFLGFFVAGIVRLLTVARV
mmetsp:Transcript_58836/g.167318  ORF Transcript_58836/g.167318 Transcript_58836/m.167318 type:complete len:107 (+) Transcript_58836:119-439(+)